MYGSGGLIDLFSSMSLFPEVKDQVLISDLLDNGGHGGEANSGSAGLRNPPAGSGPRRLSSRIMRPRFL